MPPRNIKLGGDSRYLGMYSGKDERRVKSPIQCRHVMRAAVTSTILYIVDRGLYIVQDGWGGQDIANLEDGP